MKNILQTLILFLLASYVSAQYSTPGTGVNWTMDDLVANSNGTVVSNSDGYIILSELTISPSDTLSFYSGIYLIKCNEDVLITINGVINTVGDTSYPENYVKFQPADNNNYYFKGLKFENSTGSYLRNVIFEYAGGIKMVESNATFFGCSFKGFNTENSTGALDLFKSSPKLYYCTFVYNDGPGIKSAANGLSSPKLYNCFFNQNVESNINMPQINLGTSAPNDTIVISFCGIDGGPYTKADMAGGIAVTTLAGGELNCIIENSSIWSNRYGIAVYGNNIYSVIRNNSIRFNKIQNDPMQGGSGINFWGDETNISIVSGNEITDNLWGITIQNNAKPNLGDMDNENSQGENEIYDNGNNGIIYDLYNNTPGDIKAENNYWGTNNADSIETHIYHQIDDPSLGYVDFIPFITSTGNNEIIDKTEDVTIWPVPASRFINVKFKNSDNRMVYIMNLEGKTLITLKTTEKKCKIDVSALNSGVFLVVIKNSKKTQSHKIIVE